MNPKTHKMIVMAIARHLAAFDNGPLSAAEERMLEEDLEAVVATTLGRKSVDIKKVLEAAAVLSAEINNL